jgi:histidyl-tRNA synthetase
LALSPRWSFSVTKTKVNTTTLAFSQRITSHEVFIQHFYRERFRLKKSFEAADRVARHIIILAEDEVATSTATVKAFATGEQVKIPRAELIAALRA